MNAVFDDLSWLLAIPVVLPILGAGLALMTARFPRVQAAVSVTTLAVVAIVAVALMIEVDNSPIVLDIGSWAAPMGITLVADRLASLMLLISSLVTLAVLIFSLAEGAGRDKRMPVAVYHPAFLILAAGVFDAFLAGDLFNLYVAFEMLLIASFVLITLGGTRDRVRAGTIYVIVSMVSSLIFLSALAVVYATVGTMNMAQIGLRLDEIDPTTVNIIHAMLLTAFGVKAAVFPLAAWLPDSYPTAPAPVTAVFAGLLTKVGVYAIIRVETLLIPSGNFDEVLAVIAIATMMVGILGAVAQEDLKRLLSFTLISHIGYMIWGVALDNVLGLGAAIFYVAHHITVQTALFLVSGLIERRGGTTSLTRLGSLLKVSPVIAVLYFIPAMNLAGIPPMTGFIGKVGLLQGSVQNGGALAWGMLAAGLVSSLLTLYAMTKVWNMAFWQEAPNPLPERTVPRGEYGATAFLVAFTLALMAMASPLTSYTHRAASDLTARLPYLTTVYPGGLDRPGQGESQEVIEQRGPLEDQAPTAQELESTETEADEDAEDGQDPARQRPAIPTPVITPGQGGDR